jgi:hypothetical protein
MRTMTGKEEEGGSGGGKEAEEKGAMKKGVGGLWKTMMRLVLEGMEGVENETVENEEVVVGAKGGEVEAVAVAVVGVSSEILML